MAKSGRPVSLTDAQFQAIQARKPAALKLIESYLKDRLGSADPAVMRAFGEVPREYYHYQYADHRSECGVAYEADPKPWALGYGSALSDYLGQAYMTQVAKPKPEDVTLGDRHGERVPDPRCCRGSSSTPIRLRSSSRWDMRWPSFGRHWAIRISRAG